MNDNSELRPSVRPGDSADSALLRLAGLAQELGAEEIAESARAVAERVAEGRFFVACVGQFKRGKSTLLCALVHDAVLPTGIIPITTVPTVLRYGPERSARVRYEGGAWTDIAPEELAQFVSEEHNPENRKSVAGVEVFVPSALLASGMCLVDTPGLGSVFAGNTAATQAFVPHIDAALVVLGVDPPIAGEELSLVEAVGRQVKDLLVVLNKSDRATEEERSVARSFTRQVLEKRLGRAIGPIYEASALERLEGRGSPRDWPQLLAALEGLVAEAGHALSQGAGQRGLRRMGEQVLAIVEEERGALERPLEESERRISAMHRTLADAQQSMRDLGYLMTAEQHRLSDSFLAQRKDFLARALPAAESELAESLRALPRRYGPRFRREAMRCARVVAERHVLPWLAAEQARAEQEFRQVAGRFTEFGNDYLKRLASSGVSELSRMPNALDQETGFRTGSRFTFQDLIHVAEPASPLRYLGDAALGLARAHHLMERAAGEFLLHLLEMNSARVQSDVLDRVQESRGQLEAEIRKLLQEVGRIAERALEHARAARGAGEAAVRGKMSQLEAIRREVKALLPD